MPLGIAANVQNHLRFVEAAAEQGVQWLVFPELSLTGYELAAMPSLLLHPEHVLLAPLREAAQRTGMAITVGALVDSGSTLPCIGPSPCGLTGSMLSTPSTTCTAARPNSQHRGRRLCICKPAEGKPLPEPFAPTPTTRATPHKPRRRVPRSTLLAF